MTTETQEDISTSAVAAIERAVEYFGSAAELARAVGVSDAAVSRWRLGERTPDLESCRAIEKATGLAVTRRDLRPEWYS